MGKTPTRVAERDHLKALMKLSNFSRDIKPARIERLVKKSPDPETICQAFLEEIPIPSAVLKRKWRKTLTALWVLHHPNVPLLPDLPLTREQAMSTLVLVDVINLIDKFIDAPARFIHNHGEPLLSLPDVRRLIPALESLEGDLPKQLRSENDVPTLKRLRTVLEALGILIIQGSRLDVDRFRLKSWLRLPRSYQWFTLWHLDTYHVCWGAFAPAWHDDLVIMQENLDWLWEMNEDATVGAPIDKTDWCFAIGEMFGNLFLPPVVHQVILNDLLARYGLVQFEPDGNFSWTQLGVNLIQAELAHTLPCGLELLER